MAKNKGGRPKKEIDYNVLEELCEILCTGEECASILKVDYDTLNTILERDGHVGYSDFYKKHSSVGKASLRRTQFKLAKEGNPTMLIWLGKQCLGQKEPERTVEVINDGLNWDALGKIGALLAETVDAIKPSPRTVKVNDGEQTV